MHPILQKLTGSDRRSIGRADEVAQEIVEEPELFDTVSTIILLDPLNYQQW